MRIITLLCLVLGSTLTLQFSFSEEKDSGKAILVFSKKNEDNIKNLKWDANALEIRRKDQSSTPMVLLHGNFPNLEESLITGDGGVPVDRDAKGNFELTVELKSEVNSIELVAINDQGDLETERVSVVFDKPVSKIAEVKPTATPSATPTPASDGMAKASSSPSPSDTQFEVNPSRKKWNVNAALGLTFFQYQQSFVQDSDQMELTVRVGGTYHLGESWHLSANTFINAINLSSNQSYPFGFFGINARVGYSLPKPTGSWRIVVNAGWYYLTTFGSNIGFVNLSGPQIYPTIRYTLSETQSVYGYIKFSPIAHDLSLLNLSDNETAFGVGYVFPWLGQSWSASLDIAFLSLSLPYSSISSNSESAMFGINF